jgi:hypothetical protein
MLDFRAKFRKKKLIEISHDPERQAGTQRLASPLVKRYRARKSTGAAR